jgi:hypothetical protein
MRCRSRGAPERPECSALAFDEEGLTALIATRSGPTSTLSCVEWNLRQLEPTSSERDRPRGRYAMDPARAAGALEVLCGQTPQRPAPSVRLFIEGYYMRTLVLAHEVLSASKQDPQAVERPRVLDTQEGLVRTVLRRLDDQGQDEAGYWPLGYRAGSWPTWRPWWDSLRRSSHTRIPSA